MAQHPRINIKELKKFIGQNHAEKLRLLKNGHYEHVKHFLHYLKEEPFLFPHIKWLEKFKWTPKSVAKNGHFITGLVHFNMSIKIIRKLFHKLGRLSNDDIREILEKKGIEDIKIQEIDAYNLGLRNRTTVLKIKSHWTVCWVVEDGKKYFFDSFGRKPTLPNIDDWWKIPSQPKYSHKCGYYCIWFILCMKEKMSMSDMLSLWSGQDPDEYVVRFVNK